ncbi:G-box-binding factor [Drosophila eugracilis]|uniref:G-box-binding factor n=1 Tax=Drosophila eugracilis TaxID=29029 RepID=UPI0007E8705C|nr:G-box-binding factor [Drosophila eugracilis]
MKLKAVKILLLFALLGISYVQAVVVGPQQLHNNNRNGYRYNGPAHKYLPSEKPHSHGSILDSDYDHGQQGFNGPYSSHYNGGQEQHGQGQQQYGHGQQQHGQGQQQHSPSQQQHGQGQQQHRHKQEEDYSWQSAFSQQQHQNSGNEQNHQNAQHHAYNEGSQYQQYHGLGHEQHQQINGQQQHHEQGSKQQHHQGYQPNGHSCEFSSFQQQHHQQQEKESWNSNQGQQRQPCEQQEGESWQSSLGHNFHQQPHKQFLQQPHQQQYHNRFEQQQPLRADLWQPIREHDLEKLPSAEAFANSHKTIAAPGRDVKLVPSYTLSGDFEHDRFIGLDALDTRLLTQSLPDAYRKQPFSSPSGLSSLSQRQHEQQIFNSPALSESHKNSHSDSRDGSSSDFLQMQSHSYQLPSTHSTHKGWPQNEEQQQHGSQQHATGNRQYSASAYAVSPPYLYASQPSQPSKNSLNHPSHEFKQPYY